MFVFQNFQVRTLFNMYFFYRRINVGSRFQAEIPHLRDWSLAASDHPKADLVWKPWKELETDTSVQENGKELDN